MSDIKSPQQIVGGIRPYLPSTPSVDSEPQLKRMAEEIKDFGRQKKISGAKSLAKLLREMRTKQQDYFRNNKSNYHYAQQLLKESKKLEERVDRALEAILK